MDIIKNLIIGLTLTITLSIIICSIMCIIRQCYISYLLYKNKKLFSKFYENTEKNRIEHLQKIETSCIVQKQKNKKVEYFYHCFPCGCVFERKKYIKKQCPECGAKLINEYEDFDIITVEIN